MRAVINDSPDMDYANAEEKRLGFDNFSRLHYFLRCVFPEGNFLSTRFVGSVELRHPGFLHDSSCRGAIAERRALEIKSGAATPQAQSNAACAANTG